MGYLGIGTSLENLKTSTPRPSSSWRFHEVNKKQVSRIQDRYFTSLKGFLGDFVEFEHNEGDNDFTSL